jgi:hypothetical protein
MAVGPTRSSPHFSRGGEWKCVVRCDKTRRAQLGARRRTLAVRPARRESATKSRRA